MILVLAKDDGGQDLIEYALLAGFISLPPLQPSEMSAPGSFQTT